MRKSKEKTQREPKLIEALIPIIVLIGLLYVVIHVFNEGAMGGVTMAYLPYCFFNIISPLMTMFMAAIGYKIKKVKR